MADYSLKAPCSKCPFRSDVRPFLTPDRAREIADALERGGEFPCHGTVDYDAEEEERPPRRGEQFCAGALAVMERSEAPNQMMRIAERLGIYKPGELRAAEQPVYDSLEDFVGAYEAEHERDEARRCAAARKKPKAKPKPKKARRA